MRVLLSATLMCGVVLAANASVGVVDATPEDSRAACEKCGMVLMTVEFGGTATGIAALKKLGVESALVHQVGLNRPMVLTVTGSLLNSPSTVQKVLCIEGTPGSHSQTEYMASNESRSWSHANTKSSEFLPNYMVGTQLGNRVSPRLVPRRPTPFQQPLFSNTSIVNSEIANSASNLQSVPSGSPVHASLTENDSSKERFISMHQQRAAQAEASKRSQHSRSKTNSSHSKSKTSAWSSHNLPTDPNPHVISVENPVKYDAPQSKASKSRKSKDVVTRSTKSRSIEGKSKSGSKHSRFTVERVSDINIHPSRSSRTNKSTISRSKEASRRSGHSKNSQFGSHSPAISSKISSPYIIPSVEKKTVPKRPSLSVIIPKPNMSFSSGSHNYSPIKDKSPSKVLQQSPKLSGKENPWIIDTHHPSEVENQLHSPSSKHAEQPYEQARQTSTKHSSSIPVESPLIFGPMSRERSGNISNREVTSKPKSVSRSVHSIAEKPRSPIQRSQSRTLITHSGTQRSHSRTHRSHSRKHRSHSRKHRSHSGASKLGRYSTSPSVLPGISIPTSPVTRSSHSSSAKRISNKSLYSSPVAAHPPTNPYSPLYVSGNYSRPASVMARSLSSGKTHKKSSIPSKSRSPSRTRGSKSRSAHSISRRATSTDLYDIPFPFNVRDTLADESFDEIIEFDVNDLVEVIDEIFRGKGDVTSGEFPDANTDN